MKIKNVVAKRLEKYQAKSSILYGVIGDLSTGNIEVPERTSMIYVTLFSGIVLPDILNIRVPNLLGTVVRIGYDPINLPGTLQVLGVRDSYYGDVDNPGNRPVWHHKQHEWPYGDAVYTWGEQFLPSLYYPIADTLTVSIYPGVCYTSAGWNVRTQKTTVSLVASVASITSGHARFALIVVAENGDFVVRDGALVAEQASPFISAYMMLTQANIPNPEAGDSVICAVKLYYGQTELRCNGNINDFIDLRFLGTKFDPHYYVDQAGGTGDTYGILVGARNGSNTEFTVSQGVYVSGSLSVYLNGQLLTQGSSEDWHEAVPTSGTFHFTVAPEATDEITAAYGYLAASVSAGAWQTPTLLNGWVNYGSVYGPARYYRDSIGIVHLNGLVKDGTADTIFILPAGYRPEYEELQVTIANNVIARCSISTAGAVGRTLGSNLWFSLNGITFRAYQ